MIGLAIRRFLLKLRYKLGLLPVESKAGVISSKSLYALLWAKFPGAEVWLADSEYHLCDMDAIKIFLEKDETNLYQYLDNDYDCDDFADRLMGQFAIPGWANYAIGTVWTSGHKLCGCVDVNLKFWFLEPQSDRIQDELEGWQGVQVLKVEM